MDKVLEGDGYDEPSLECWGMTMSVHHRRVQAMLVHLQMRGHGVAFPYLSNAGSTQQLRRWIGLDMLHGLWLWIRRRRLQQEMIARATSVAAHHHSSHAIGNLLLQVHFILIYAVAIRSSLYQQKLVLISPADHDGWRRPTMHGWPQRPRESQLSAAAASLTGRRRRGRLGRPVTTKRSRHT
jgi:hypothetical protein